jgi:dihydrofolate synthase/folylpolyglutamate synthase
LRPADDRGRPGATGIGPGAVERLLALAPFERSGMRPGLERIEALLDALGHPEAGLRILHVGGTNGKGSVSALAEAILRAAGYRTGLYTSPHLLDVRERVRLAGRPIPADAFARHAERLAPPLAQGAATFFEAMTALALVAFAEAAVDVAVLEVGLGGRWDATNVGRPVASVITRIDFDHQEFLGSRLADIAVEKAAIIRGGVALSAAQAPEALAAVERRCREVGVPLLLEGRDIHVAVARAGLDGQRLSVDGPGWRLPDLDLALAGLYQPGNAALAIAAVRAAGFAVPDDAVRAGAAAVRWPGRFQVIPAAPGRPTMVLDGAHNPGGAAALATSLAHHFAGRRLALVLGVSADKDRAGILKPLAPLAAHIVLTAAAHPRATPPAELAAALPPVDARVSVAPDAAHALRIAMADPAIDAIGVAGSLFLVADALRDLRARGIVDPDLA